jgi:hypothetical protein
MVSHAVEQQVSDLVDSLRQMNEKEEKKGARKIPDTEYTQLKSLLLKKVIRTK